MFSHLAALSSDSKIIENINDAVRSNEVAKVPYQMRDGAIDRKSVTLLSEYRQDLVSVIIPSYQSKDTVVETIESVLNQEYNDIEIIVVDDGSTDGTSGYLIERFGEKIILFRQDNKGLSGARNAGLSISKGEFIQFLDADDLIYPNKIRCQVDFLRTNIHVDIVNSSYEILNNNIKESAAAHDYSGLYTKDAFLAGNPVGAVFSPLLRRSVVVEVGGFDEGFDNYCADWEFWLTAYYMGFNFDNLHDVYGAYRVSALGLTQSAKLPNKLGDLRVQKRWAAYYPKYVFSYFYRRYLCISLFDAGLYAANEKGRKNAVKFLHEALKHAPLKLKFFLMCACLLVFVTPESVLKYRSSLSRLRGVF